MAPAVKQIQRSALSGINQIRSNEQLQFIGGTTVGFLSEFRRFILQDKVVNLAVAVIIGTAFVEIVRSLVKDLVAPILALIGGGGNMNELFWVMRKGNGTGDYGTVDEADAAGAVTLNYGRFFQSIFTFFIMAICVFLVMKLVMTLRMENKKTEKSPPVVVCPKCKEPVQPSAVRCPHCHTEPINYGNLEYADQSSSHSKPSLVRKNSKDIVVVVDDEAMDFARKNMPPDYDPPAPPSDD